MKKLLVRLAIGVIGLWVLSLLAVWFTLPNWNARAGFGEMFGAVNALFSGLALAGIIATIYLQSRELEMQREQLRNAAESQRNSESILAEQLSALRGQVFALRDSATIQSKQAVALEQTVSLQCLASLAHAYSAILVERPINVDATDISNRLNRCTDRLESLASRTGFDSMPR